MHVLSRKDLNSAEVETLRVSRSPTTVITVNIPHLLTLCTSAHINFLAWLKTVPPFMRTVAWCVTPSFISLPLNPDLFFLWETLNPLIHDVSDSVADWLKRTLLQVRGRRSRVKTNSWSSDVETGERTCRQWCKRLVICESSGRYGTLWFWVTKQESTWGKCAQEMLKRLWCKGLDQFTRRSGQQSASMKNWRREHGLSQPSLSCERKWGSGVPTSTAMWPENHSWKEDGCKRDSSVSVGRM